MDGQTLTARCGACGKRYRVKAAMAGKRVKCKCGEAMTVPEAPDDGDDLLSDPTSAPAAETSSAPKPWEGILATAGRSKSPVVEALERGEDEVKVTPWETTYLPLTLLAVGWVLHAVTWFSLSETTAMAVGGLLASTAAHAVVFLPIALMTCVYVGGLLDVAFGELREVAWKLAAITLGPGAVGDDLFFAFLREVDFDIWVMPAAFILPMIFTGGSIMWVFRVNLHATALIVAIITVPRFVVLFGLEMLFPGTFFGGG